jgi:hypothetical protein
MLHGRPVAPRCSACGAALTALEARAGGVCGQAECRHRRHERQANAEAQAAMQRARDADAARRADPALAQAPVIAVERLRSEGHVPVPATWRASLEAHLRGLEPEARALRDGPSAEPVDDGGPRFAQAAEDGASAAAAATGGDAAQAALQALKGGICAACGGYCCWAGNGHHGFITAPVLARVWRRLGDVPFDALVAHYLAALPALHRENACGFQGEQGCSLPREERGDICNAWECPGLKEVDRLASAGGVQAVYVVRRRRSDLPATLRGVFVPPPS